MSNEPLLQVDQKRFALYPIKHKDAYDLYKLSLTMFWVPEEISLANDRKDWEKLNDDERHFISHILAFFAGADTIVTDNLAETFMREIQVLEARFFYGQQIAVENIHSETYSMLLETFISDQEQKMKMLNAIDEIPVVQEKAKWAMKWTDLSKPLGERLIAFAVVEGVFFSGSFCAIFWLKKRGILPGLCHSNELIMKDEGVHCDFACLMSNNYVKNKPSEERVKEIFAEAVEIESRFITESLPVAMIGMNSKLMKQYIRYVADFWLGQLGHSPLYGDTNPFDWMDLQSMRVKSNFFERRVSEYAKVQHVDQLEELDDF